MNKLMHAMTFATLAFSTTLANGQCENGVCRLPARGQVQSTYPQNSNAYHRFEDFQRPASSPANCKDGTCDLTERCRNCRCLPGNCNCGPNCATRCGVVTPEVCRDGLCDLNGSLQNGYGQRRGNFEAPLPKSQPNRGITRPFRRPAVDYRAVSNTVSIPWLRNYERALAESRKTGLPMMVRVGAEWCDYCKRMKRETYTDRRLIRDISTGFIPVDLDGDMDRKLVEQMGVRTLPTTLIITPNLRITERIEGFRTAQQLSGTLLRHTKRVELPASRAVVVR